MKMKQDGDFDFSQWSFLGPQAARDIDAIIRAELKATLSHRENWEDTSAWLDCGADAEGTMSVTFCFSGFGDDVVSFRTDFAEMVDELAESHTPDNDALNKLAAMFDGYAAIVRGYLTPQP